MSSIQESQNQPSQLRRLEAQRQLYSSAKKIFLIQVVLSGPVAVGSALLVLSDPTLKGFVAFWGICVAFIDLLILTPWQKRLREAAARIQETFDCDVLKMPWNEIKVGKLPDPELVLEQSEKYKTWGIKMPPISNWYAPVVGELPLHIGRIVCQRSNCWWDSKLRRRYAIWIMVLEVLVIALILWIALGNQFSVEDLVLKLAAPLAPALLLGIRQFAEQIDSATRLDKLRDHSERLWKDALDNGLEPAISARSRVLQDEIFENRKKNPLIFDAIYKWLQRDYEVQMNHGALELVAEAKAKLNIL
jgi:hypothetical protein